MPYNNNGYANNYNGGNKGGNFPKYSGNAAPRKRADDNTTNGVLLKNESAGKFLRMGYWNGTMKTDIGTIQPGMEINASSIQGAQTFGHVFSFAAMADLYEICVEIEESMKKGEPIVPMAVVAGQKKDTILEISDGSNIGMPTGLYFVLYKGVDAGSRTNTFDIYPFDSTVVLKNYNHSTGESILEPKKLGDFKKFKTVLKESMKAFTNAQAHVVKEVNKKNNPLAALAAIGNALGVDINKSVMEATSGRSNSKPNYNRNNYNNGNGFQRSTQSGQWDNKQFTAQQAITNEAVDINMDSATLQQVDMSQFTNQ